MSIRPVQPRRRRRRIYARHMLRRPTLVAPAALTCLLALVALAPGSTVKRAPRCEVFPRDNHWNVRVDGLPVASDSAALVRSIGLDRPVHPDFGAGLYEGRPIGIPYTTVSRRQRRVRVSFDYAGRVRPRPLPDPAPRADRGRAQLGRRPARDRRRPRSLPAVRAVRRLPAVAAAGAGGPARAPSGACAPTGCARAAGPRRTPPACRSCPAWPATRRCARGAIDHALRFTAQRTRRAYVYPARHFASSDSDPDLPPMGAARAAARRLRHIGLPAPGPDRPDGAEALRDDPGRQRLAVVHQRRAVERLEQRGPARAAPRARRRLRGGRHLVAAAPAGRVRREHGAGAVYAGPSSRTWSPTRIAPPRTTSARRPPRSHEPLQHAGLGDASRGGCTGRTGGCRPPRPLRR